MKEIACWIMVVGDTVFGVVIGTALAVLIVTAWCGSLWWQHGTYKR